MNRLVLSVSILSLLAAFSFAGDTFYLTTQSGEKYGPFEFKEGAALKVGKDGAGQEAGRMRPGKRHN